MLREYVSAKPRAPDPALAKTGTPKDRSRPSAVGRDARAKVEEWREVKSFLER